MRSQLSTHSVCQTVIEKDSTFYYAKVYYFVLNKVSPKS